MNALSGMRKKVDAPIRHRPLAFRRHFIVEGSLSAQFLRVVPLGSCGGARFSEVLVVPPPPFFSFHHFTVSRLISRVFFSLGVYVS